MVKNYKKILLAGVVIFLAAGCSNKIAVQNQSPLPVSNQQSSSSPAGQTITRQNTTSPDHVPAQQLTVTQTVEGSSLNKESYNFTQGQTALDLLKASHKVETKVYSGIGEYVTSIDGSKPDSQHFWEFFVNGKSSNVGSSSYKLNNSDKIEWKLSKIGNYSN